jgi:hypothetical protein
VSPSEAQLRAALQDGEGDSDAPDATALISHAVRVRRDRHRRITSIAGGVAVVAVIGVGLTALVTSGQGSESAGSGGSTADSALKGGAAGVVAHAPAQRPQDSSGRSAESRRSAGSAPLPHAYVTSGAASSASRLKCPATADRLMSPGGGGSGQFGSSDPLFAQKVAAMRICAYPQRVGARTQTKTYDAAEARQIASELDAAPDTRPSASCPANTDYAGGEIEFLAVNAKGEAMKPVVLTLACQASQATNGTAVRYVITVPTPALQLFAGHELPRPGHTMGGSPLH